MNTSPLRIALLGAESTGKSTLAAALAAHYDTVWVPEYLREFVEEKQRTPQEKEQFLIASTQLEREDDANRKARTFLFCDTTPLMTAIYSQFYFGSIDAKLENLLRAQRYDFTIVTEPSTPWIADGLQRESDAVRQAVHTLLLATLAAEAIPFLLVSGDVAERVQQVSTYLSAKYQSP
ncbi:AAA family ATPase [Herminiimonas sp. NPDC097707]|uniref:AAA family ATPase n=1 Tax=Herminiimonas sp. NPDC097707 TaxID=3364007 RepID=UPI00383BE83F